MVGKFLSKILPLNQTGCNSAHRYGSGKVDRRALPEPGKSDQTLIPLTLLRVPPWKKKSRRFGRRFWL